MTIKPKAAKPAIKDPVIQQRKVSRGSRRRIIRALDKFDVAAKEVCSELDMQMFEVDEKGNRCGKIRAVTDIFATAQRARNDVMAVLNEE